MIFKLEEQARAVDAARRDVQHELNHADDMAQDVKDELSLRLDVLKDAAQTLRTLATFRELMGG